MSGTFDGHPVRVLGTPDKPLFVCKDVCDAIGLLNSRKAMRGIQPSERGVTICDTHGGPQRFSVLTEAGLYAMIFKSRKEHAKRFQRWVTKDVLPSIRKTGKYVAETAAPQPALPAPAAPPAARATSFLEVYTIAAAHLAAGDRAMVDAVSVGDGSHTGTIGKKFSSGPPTSVEEKYSRGIPMPVERTETSSSPTGGILECLSQNRRI